jgi:hypothetical protein
MNGPEHYQKAQQYLEKAAGSLHSDYDGYVARAQVHATLALAAATAINDYPEGAPLADVAAWRAVAGVKAQDDPRPSVRGGDPIGHEAELGYRREQDDQ